MSIFAFGDIHGEFLKLKNLINKIYFSKEDTLVFLGDYIDRGKMTFEVIDYLIELNKNYKCIFLYGNHESMFMDFMSGINEDMFHINGGKKTIASYAKHGYDIRKNVYYLNRKIPKNHIKFFQRLRRYYETDNFIFVHAGIFPGISLRESSDDILLWCRQFSSIPYEGKPVIYGHSPNSTILNEEYKICIDTGACFESMGDLTCVQLPERHFYRQGKIMEDIINGNGDQSTIKEDV
jgi:serine/threonine protein phosphatase 1